MGWKTENNNLVKEFIFSDFVQAVNFVNQIVPISEKANHHPNIYIHSYKKVRIELFTHSEGRITTKDFDLAMEIDRISL